MRERMKMDAKEKNVIFDGRIVTVFNTLDERKENKILTWLIDMIYYYSIISVEKGEMEGNKMFQYFVRNIKKPLSLQKLLKDSDVAIDAINYIQECYRDVVLIKAALTDNEFRPFIDTTREYNREHYKIVMKCLLVDNTDKQEVKSITNYLEKHRITEDNMPDIYIQRIVDKIYAVI
jgi:hypothetical protein